MSSFTSQNGYHGYAHMINLLLHVFLHLSKRLPWLRTSDQSSPAGLPSPVFFFFFFCVRRLCHQILHWSKRLPWLHKSDQSSLARLPSPIKMVTHIHTHQTIFFTCLSNRSRSSAGVPRMRASSCKLLRLDSSSWSWSYRRTENQPHITLVHGAGRTDALKTNHI